MNTRGLTELVVLNIGLAVGILDQQLFTVLVLMAIITTIMTEPLLRLVYPDRAVARDIVEAERAALGLRGRAPGAGADRGRHRPARRGQCSGPARKPRGQRAADHPDRTTPGPAAGGRLRSHFGHGRGGKVDGADAVAGPPGQGCRGGGPRELAAGRRPRRRGPVHAEAAAADVVVLAAGSVLADALAGRADRVVVEVARWRLQTTDAGGHRRRETGYVAGRDAAVEQAVRFAERLELPLVLVDGGGPARSCGGPRRSSAGSPPRGVTSARSTEEQLAAEVANGPRLVWFQGPPTAGRWRSRPLPTSCSWSVAAPTTTTSGWTRCWPGERPNRCADRSRRRAAVVDGTAVARSLPTTMTVAGPRSAWRPLRLSRSRVSRSRARPGGHGLARRARRRPARSIGWSARRPRRSSRRSPSSSMVPRGTGHDRRVRICPEPDRDDLRGRRSVVAGAPRHRGGDDAQTQSGAHGEPRRPPPPREWTRRGVGGRRLPEPRRQQSVPPVGAVRCPAHPGDRPVAPRGHGRRRDLLEPAHQLRRQGRRAGVLGQAGEEGGGRPSWAVPEAWSGGRVVPAASGP